MLAATYSSGGDSSVLSVHEVPTPEPGPGEVRVRLALSGVNPTDWKRRRGFSSADGRFVIPNQDGAGVIDAVGPGVESSRVGERVWVLLAAHENRWGTAAQYSVLPALRAVPLPDQASFELGASLGVPALTAAHCLTLAGGAGARTVLVSGGAGAVGHAAIELARFYGARNVIATVSSPEKAALASAAGAHTVVNYRDADASAQIRAAAGGGVDCFIEVALDHNLELDLEVAAPHATIVSYAGTASSAPRVPVRRLMLANASLRFMILYAVQPEQLRSAIARVSAAVQTGALTTLPLHRFPLSQIAQAHDAVEHGAVGKVLIDLQAARS